jgi:hypothetical protein
MFPSMVTLLLSSILPLITALVLSDFSANCTFIRDVGGKPDHPFARSPLLRKLLDRFWLTFRRGLGRFDTHAPD